MCFVSPWESSDNHSCHPWGLQMPCQGNQDGVWHGDGRHCDMPSSPRQVGTKRLVMVGSFGGAVMGSAQVESCLTSCNGSFWRQRWVHRSPATLNGNFWSWWWVWPKRSPATIVTGGPVGGSHELGKEGDSRHDRAFHVGVAPLRDVGEGFSVFLRIPDVFSSLPDERGSRI